MIVTHSVILYNNLFLRLGLLGIVSRGSRGDLLHKTVALPDWIPYTEKSRYVGKRSNFSYRDAIDMETLPSKGNIYF